MNSSTITADWLREQAAAPSGVIPLSAVMGPMLADALEIADSCARADIESECYGFKRQGADRVEFKVWDTSRSDPHAIPGAVAQAIRYLTARGLIEFDVASPQLVRLLDEPKA